MRQSVVSNLNHAKKKANAPKGAERKKMGLLGRILSVPFKVANVPFRAMEELVDAADGTPSRKEDRILSAPLKAVSDAVEEI